MAKTVWEQQAEADWPNYEGDLDAALASLRETDRRAVMLRFYEHKSFDEIAHILGTAEEAARKRVSRAVEKLRGYFGVNTRTLPSTMVSYYLATKLTAQAPPALAHIVTLAATNSIVEAAAAGAAMTSASQLAHEVTRHLMIIKARWLATGLAAAVLLCAAGGVAVLHALDAHPAQGQTIPVEREMHIR